MKKVFKNILRGGHRNPYQLENAIKSDGTVFCLYLSLGVNSLPGSCVEIEKVLKDGEERSRKLENPMPA